MYAKTKVLQCNRQPKRNLCKKKLISADLMIFLEIFSN